VHVIIHHFISYISVYKIDIERVNRYSEPHTITSETQVHTPIKIAIVPEKTTESQKKYTMLKQSETPTRGERKDSEKIQDKIPQKIREKVSEKIPEKILGKSGEHTEMISIELFRQVKFEVGKVIF
jgi:uncharacterized protein YueI